MVSVKARRFILLSFVFGALLFGALAMRFIAYRYKPAECHRSTATVFKRDALSVVRVESVCDGAATTVAWLELRDGRSKPQKFFEYETMPDWHADETTPTLDWARADGFTIYLPRVWVVRRMDVTAAGWRVDYAIGKIERPGGQ